MSKLALPERQEKEMVRSLTEISQGRNLPKVMVWVHQQDLGLVLTALPPGSESTPGASWSLLWPVPTMCPWEDTCDSCTVKAPFQKELLNRQNVNKLRSGEFQGYVGPFIFVFASLRRWFPFFSAYNKRSPRGQTLSRCFTLSSYYLI